MPSAFVTGGTPAVFATDEARVHRHVTELSLGEQFERDRRRDAEPEAAIATLARALAV